MRTEGLRAALAFFTRLPVGRPDAPGTDQGAGFQGAAGWLPVVGLVVGCLAGAVTAVAGHFLPPFACGVIGCFAWTALTGGLHLDGVADCGDGLWVEAGTQRRLEIMRDARLGTFGGAALFFALALKAAALAALAGLAAQAGHGAVSALNLLTACACSGLFARTAVFVLMRRPSARPGGLGAALRAGVGRREEIRAMLFTAAACGAGLTLGPSGLLAPAAVLCLTFRLARTAERRLGGVTGDVFGCLVESAECVALLAFAAQW